MAKLTKKQSMFVKEYIVDFNATRAAIEAGYSKKTARQIACENLTKPYIQKAIVKELGKHTEKLDIDVDNVLKDIIDTRAWCADAMATGNDKAVNGRLKANEMLGKYLSMFSDKLEVEIKEIPKIILKRGGELE